MPSVRPALKNSLFLSCLAAFFAGYFLHFPIPHALDRLTDISVALSIAVSAGGYGDYVLTRLLKNKLGVWEHGILAATLGFGVLSSLMILLGLLHVWITPATVILLGAGLFLCRSFLLFLKKGWLEATSQTTLSIQSAMPLVAILLGGIVSFLLAFAPITYYDSLVYHLTLPAAYIQAGRWVGVPELIYSAFPQTLEMLWTLGLLLRNDTVVNLISWTLSGLLIGAVIAFGKRFFQKEVGWMAAALIAIMPSFLLLSSGGYIDLGLTLFSFLSFYAACLWYVYRDRGMAIVSGLFAGWAMGTKYTGAIGAVLTGALILWGPAIDREREVTTRKLTLGDFLRYAGAALAVFSPWLIKNTIYVGNPVFPFFYQWGLRGLNPWLNQAAAGYFAGLTEYHSRSFLELFRLLWDIPVQATRFGGGIDVLGDLGWIPFFGFLPAVWLRRKQSWMTKWLLVYAGLYFIPWGMSRPVLRFLFPLVPVLSLAVSEGWVQGIARQPALVRGMARCVMGSFILSGIFLFFFVADVFSPFRVALGIEEREGYLSRKINYYAAASYINSHLPKNALVYIVGGQCGYYYQRNIRISPVFSKNRFAEWTNSASTPEALLQKLKQEGATHLLVNRSEMARLRGYNSLPFNERGEANWNALQSQGSKRLYRDSHCDVFEL